jgi:hypothetical protein
VFAAAAAPRILVDFESSPHGGHWRPLPESGDEPAISMRTVIHHSIVGSAEGAYQYFRGSTSIESTFIVKKNGYFWQIMSLGEQADANFRANAFAGSIETEDNGHPDTDPWTSAQIDILVWLSREIRRLRPRIARRKCRTWDDAGLGYHTLFPGGVSRSTPQTPCTSSPSDAYRPTTPAQGRSASGGGRAGCCRAICRVPSRRTTT